MKMLTDEEMRSKFRASCDILIKKSADECESIIKRAALTANNLVNISDDENMQKQAHSYQYYYIIHQNELSYYEARMMYPDRKKITCVY